MTREARAGRVADPAKIGAAADRIIRDSAFGCCFSTTIPKVFFPSDYVEAAYKYDIELLAGCDVLSTSLSNETASVADIVRMSTLLGPSAPLGSSHRCNAWTKHQLGTRVRRATSRRSEPLRRSEGPRSLRALPHGRCSSSGSSAGDLGNSPGSISEIPQMTTR